MRRKQREARQALLDELHASRESVRSLTEAVFRMEAQLASRLERVEQSQSATEVLVTYFGRRVIENEAALASAVGQLGSLCEALTTRIANDREERRALVEMIGAITAVREPVAPPAVEIDLTTPRVVGGTFFAGPPPSRPAAALDDQELPRGWRKWAKR